MLATLDPKTNFLESINKVSLFKSYYIVDIRQDLSPHPSLPDARSGRIKVRGKIQFPIQSSYGIGRLVRTGMSPSDITT